MIRVVLDTNVFISALFWKGAPYQVFKRILEGVILNFISPQILEELKERLLYKFKLPSEKVREFLEIIVFNSQIVYPKKKLNVVKKDPKDNKILECALEAQASFIISGDKHLLEIKEYKGIKIISPKEFLNEIK
jgi:putative PIN family toxin of toxin-antitoxin system